MHDAYGYVTKSEESKDRVRLLKLQTSDFLQKRGNMSITLPRSKKEISEVANKEEVKCFSRQNKKLEDLATIQRLTENLESKEGQNKELLEKYLKVVVNKQFFVALLRSVGTVSETSYQSKMSSLQSVWQGLTHLPVDNKLDMLFGVLLSKFNRTVFGKSFKSSIPTNNLLSTLEAYSGSLTSIVDCLAKMASVQSETSLLETLDRHYVECHRERLLFLVEALAEQGVVVTTLRSPFCSEKSVEQRLLHVFARQLKDTLGTLHGLLVAGMYNCQGFHQVFKGELLDQINEGSTEHTKKCFGLIKLYNQALIAFKAALKSSANQDALSLEAQKEVDQLESKIAQNQRLKSLFDSITWGRLKERILS